MGSPVNPVRQGKAKEGWDEAAVIGWWGTGLKCWQRLIGGDWIHSATRRQGLSAGPMRSPVQRAHFNLDGLPLGPGISHAVYRTMITLIWHSDGMHKGAE